MMTKHILGVRFLTGSAPEVVKAGLRGGLVVVPSAPVLVDLADKPALREAVLGADLAITDSGLMVLLWWLLKREKLERVSGLEYLVLLLQRLRPETGNLKPEGSDPKESENPQVSGFSPQVSHASGVFWVMPTEAARDQNLGWLRSQGFSTAEADCYVAPKYAAAGPLKDEKLLAIIQQRRPAHIIMALGGGVQERLGYALREALRAPQLSDTGCKLSESGSDSKPNNGQPTANNPAAQLPGIHCIGAAIGFLSGEQVRIPVWVDYFYLGWLWRTVSAPGKFLPRYWKAIRLVGLMIRFGERSPVWPAKP